MTEKIVAVNDQLRNRFGERYIPAYDSFLDDEGKCIDSMFAKDGLHLSKKGMAVLMRLYLNIVGKPKECQFSDDRKSTEYETDVCLEDMTIDLKVDNNIIRALVDTGSSLTLLSERIV